MRTEQGCLSSCPQECTTLVQWKSALLTGERSQASGGEQPGTEPATSHATRSGVCPSGLVVTRPRHRVDVGKSGVSRRYWVTSVSPLPACGRPWVKALGLPESQFPGPTGSRTARGAGHQTPASPAPTSQDGKESQGVGADAETSVSPRHLMAPLKVPRLPAPPLACEGPGLGAGTLSPGRDQGRGPPRRGWGSVQAAVCWLGGRGQWVRGGRAGIAGWRRSGTFLRLRPRQKPDPGGAGRPLAFGRRCVFTVI